MAKVGARASVHSAGAMQSAVPVKKSEGNVALRRHEGEWAGVVRARGLGAAGRQGCGFRVRVQGQDAKGEGQRRTVQVEVLEDGGTEAASLGEEARGEERGLGAE
eukprot:2180444-Prymnesium_polylepis.2